jgi:hypothetical protein
MSNLLTLIKRKMGWRDCPECGRFARFRFIQITVIFADEPPLFGRWQCCKCEWLSPISHTPIMDEGARANGYKDFLDWADKNVKETD